MTNYVEDFQKISKEHTEALTASATTLTKGLQAIAVETSDFTKKSIEESTAIVEKLLGAKTPDVAIKIQTDFAKSSYEALVAQATKVGELYTNLAKELFKPVEDAFAKVVAK